MRKFWTFLIVIICLAGAAYVWRAEWVPKAAPYLPAQVLAYLQPAADAGSGQNAGDKPAAGNGGWSGNKNGGKRGGNAVTVKVVEAKAGDLPILRDSFGYIVARDTTSLSSPIAGMVTAINVQNGAEVKAGDVIVTYDARALEATLAKDQATLAKDQATYDNAVTTMKRTANLGEQGASTQQATDNAKAALQQAEAALTLDRAQIDADKVSLSNAQVVAPYDGQIGIISVSKGAYVSAGTAVGTIVDNKNVYAQFTLSEADLTLSRTALANKELSVAVKPTNATDGTQVINGPVTFIDNQVDQSSGTFRLWALIDNSAKVFWPGESVNATVTAGYSRNLVTVPNVAVSPQQKGMGAFVSGDDNKAQMRTDTVALRSHGTTGVTDGIKAGEKVVIEGQQSLTDGATVKIDDGTAKPAGDQGGSNNKKWDGKKKSGQWNGNSSSGANAAELDQTNKKAN